MSHEVSPGTAAVRVIAFLAEGAVCKVEHEVHVVAPVRPPDELAEMAARTYNAIRNRAQAIMS